MLYKISLHHEDGYIDEKYTKAFEVAEKTIKNDDWVYLAWITEFQLKGDTFESTHNAWQYQKVENEFVKTEHKVF